MKIKKMIALGICMLVCASMIACSNGNNGRETAKQDKENTKGAVEIPNPIVDYENVDEAKKALELDIINIPNNFGKPTSVSVIDNNILQLIYRLGDNEITYRVSKELDDIDGNFTEYPDNYTIDVGAIQVNVEGKDNNVFVAKWSEEGLNYSITSRIGVSEDDIIGALK